MQKLEKIANVSAVHPLEWLRDNTNRADAYQEDPRPQYEPDPNVVRVMKYMDFGKDASSIYKLDRTDIIRKFMLLDKLPHPIKEAQDKRK